MTLQPHPKLSVKAHSYKAKAMPLSNCAVPFTIVITGVRQTSREQRDPARSLLVYQKLELLY